MLLLVAVMFIRLQYDMSKDSSLSAQLQSTSFTIGADASGVIDKQYVQEGDTIHAGEVLFEIHSPDLATSVGTNGLTVSHTVYSLARNGDIRVTAAAGGVVQKINFPAGSFVPANSNIAVIDSQSTMYVSATFKLSPPDYAKLHNGNTVAVTLPDNHRLTGTAYGISLNTTNKQIYTTLKVRVNQDQINRDVFTVGTPVRATLYLDTTTLYGSLDHFVRLHIFGKL